MYASGCIIFGERILGSVTVSHGILYKVEILTGNYKNRAFQNTNAVIPGANNSLPIHDIHYKDFRLIYTMQFFAGPSWQKIFSNMRTELFLGYEFTIWNNLSAIYRSNRIAAPAGKETYINTSLLGLQGITFRWTLDF